jgi:hypothetical protein
MENHVDDQCEPSVLETSGPIANTLFSFVATHLANDGESYGVHRKSSMPVPLCDTAHAERSCCEQRQHDATQNRLLHHNPSNQRGPGTFCPPSMQLSATVNYRFCDLPYRSTSLGLSFASSSVRGAVVFLFLEASHHGPPG